MLIFHFFIFKKFSMNILYYWTDFLEITEIEKSRSLFLELQKENGINQ